ncbi:MAG: deoxynucleoside kinase [Thiohalomonadales bacterium]
MSTLPQYIVVEGPIGVGKTSLARRLANSFDSEVLLEEAEKNPFLEGFYQNRQQSALPTQLFFLLQRAKQIQEIRQCDMFAPTRVADFLLEKDRLFAAITLDVDEMSIYDQVYDTLTLQAPLPDLVVYLQAPVDVLMVRIRKRGREIEASIDTTYMQKLVDEYTRFFYYYNATPLLIVNAEQIDLVSNDQDYELLLQQIRQMGSGRHYYNPIPFVQD